MKSPWFYCVYWIFSYITDKYSCLNCCISTKLSQIVCLVNVHILACQRAKCHCRLRKFLFRFLRTLALHIWNVITSSNFYKLYVKEWKVNLCNHLRLSQSVFHRNLICIVYQLVLFYPWGFSVGFVGHKNQIYVKIV